MCLLVDRVKIEVILDVTLEVTLIFFILVTALSFMWQNLSLPSMESGWGVKVLSFH